MLTSRPRTSAISLAVSTSVVLFSAGSAHAALKYYYDPMTGNVAFDTSETRNGMLHSFFLSISRHSSSPFVFQHQNQLRLSNSTFFTSTPHTLGDSTQSLQWQGLYTIGNILPAGLTQETWNTFFTPFFSNPSIGRGAHYHVDIVGGGLPEPAQFVYGAPSGEFKNRLDLVDPDSLRWADQATLVYQARTGEVIVKTNGPEGGYITGILLESNGAFLPGGFDPSIDPGPFATANPSDIFMVVDLVEPGLFSLGEILPARLTAATFQSLFTSAKFLGRAGFKSQDFDFATRGQNFELAFVAVPEPSAITLLVLAVLVVAKKRER